MKHEEILELLRSPGLGPAIRLLVTYWLASDVGEGPWFGVLDGEVCTDEEWGRWLGVSTSTVARWRKRLIKTGWVQGEKYTGGYRIHVKRPRHLMPGSDLDHRRAAIARGVLPWPELSNRAIQ